MWHRPDNQSTESRDTGVFPCPEMGKDGNEPNMNLFLCELLTNIANT